MSGSAEDTPMNQDDRSVECQGCGAPLTEESEGGCPECGETKRLIRLSVREEIKVSSRAVAHRPPRDASDESEGVRIAGPDTRSASVDVNSRASVNYEIAGNAPRGEEGALETANLLIQKLRSAGEAWSDPIMVDIADVDCESRNGDDILSMQVTRVPRSSSFWQRLGRQAAASEVGSADDLAVELMAVIKHKAMRLAQTQRAELALVLDARDTPAFATSGVTARFSELHATEATNLGFRSIWVVGPTVQLVGQLA